MSTPANPEGVPLWEAEPEARLKVSVAFLTYNHQPYVRQALDSVLQQQVDFDYEIIIGDDDSTDGTTEICQAYRDAHPDRIVMLPSKPKLGMMGNSLRLWRHSRGRYLSPLEGDDYWSTPQKLARQVAMLDAHPEVSMCFAVSRILRPTSGPQPEWKRPRVPKAFYDLPDLLRENLATTASTMFRRGVVTAIPTCFLELPQLDWTMSLLHAERGPVAFLDRELAVYRIHARGAWSGTSYRANCHKVIASLNAWRRHLAPRHDRLIRQKIAHHWYEIAFDEALGGDLAAARQHMNQVFQGGLPNPDVPLRRLLALALRTRWPALHRHLKTRLGRKAG